MTKLDDSINDYNDNYVNIGYNQSTRKYLSNLRNTFKEK